MYQIDFQHPVHVFFCGIGGISMSGLAEILKSRGFTVSGSDRAESSITDKLSQGGVRVLIGQRSENITPDIDLVVFTSAIHPDNPEYIRTSELNIPSLTRAELLGQIMKNYSMPVAVSGTHGKTTTTSMISEILLDADTDPTLSIGGNLPSIGGNVRVGGSGYFVAEACEYTNSFLSFYPRISIILNIDADHLDFFKDLNDIRNSFRKFAQLTPADGALIINADIPDLQEITEGLSCKVITYGRDPSCDYWAEDIRFDGGAHPDFLLCRRLEDGTVLRRHVRLGVTGEHNVFNSLAAAAAADLLEIPAAHVDSALERFTGTDRRFQLKGKIGGITILDDYAHHPTEIAATLRSAKATGHKRVVCVFQPHTYSRTKSLFDEFAHALSAADLCILADIYAARETDTLGVSSRMLADRINETGGSALYLPSFEEIENYIRKNCQEDDLLITMGAGNVYEIGDHLLSSGS
ncbi:MAG: UDP-N-acetylmuramate--L-alanine ligase [Lachnospiraceae bacterium]|nr:UDP-N-acetylmuramate--L-alanine ligase [Lachnospiraceae bacterium]